MAPLTLLVGENSTGKTSFLAILRALWEVAVNEVVPDFRREPYDLGAFSEIVYNDSSRGDQADAFQAGFKDAGSGDSDKPLSFRFTFQDLDGVTFPTSRFALVGGTSFQVSARPELRAELQLAIGDRMWKTMTSVQNRFMLVGERLFPIELAIWDASNEVEQNGPESLARELPEQYGRSSLCEDEVERARESQRTLESWRLHQWYAHGGNRDAPFAGAPVRSKPRRTYDPLRLIPDPEGEYVPTYLANMARREPSRWSHLKSRLEEFGSRSGLFDEISIESFGRTGDATPFQIQTRKFGGKLKGNRRNLIDMGYGVSQALPIVTELLRSDAPRMFLLQQPEVHLHPSAQAALGSLFCSIAGPDRQLVVETHSDYIIDRVRMDVRDGTTDLKPEDVSILYFERGESDVKIHSIRLDELGNVLDAPDSYGQFFADELTRSIGL